MIAIIYIKLLYNVLVLCLETIKFTVFYLTIHTIDLQPHTMGVVRYIFLHLGRQLIVRIQCCVSLWDRSGVEVVQSGELHTHMVERDGSLRQAASCQP